MKHAATAQELAKILFEFSYWHEIQGQPYKPRAYQLASESVGALGDDIEETWRKGGLKELEKLPAIGKSIAGKIDEYFKTGHIKEYDRMKKKFPVDIWELSRIEGVGPRHIADLYTHLKVKSIADLKRALKAHRVRTMPRWSEKTEEKLSLGVSLSERASGRRLLGEILPYADEIVRTLSDIPGVSRCAYAGSLRRRQETVGDIDLIATSSDPERVMDIFTRLPIVQTVHEHGKTRASVRLTIGIDADLRVVPDEVYGATLQYFTGDKRHNVLLREHALSKGFTLNEYGLFHAKRGNGEHKKGSLIACHTEEEIYQKLGMDTPPPEIRIGNEEIDAAKEHRLPDLLLYGSVQGDLQVQTDWTDGNASIKEMAIAAKTAGLSYIAVTDHTKSLAFVGGLDEKGIAKQAKEIAKLNEELKDFRVLRGTECDILKDGSLDLDDAALAFLEWVGVSVHSNFGLSRAAQTERVIKALSNPYVDCFFHPTCRIIGKREGIDLDMDEILAAAKKYRVALEIDAFPERSDLRDIHVRAAVRAGVMLVIDSDAHAPEHFRYLPLGEAIARRGWAEKKHILNTKSLEGVLAYLDKKRKRA
jgi:DNA polymerase (family 10)